MPRRWAIFLITSANFFLSQFYRASMAVISPELLQELSLSTRQLGMVSAAFFYTFALAQIPISIFLDKIGARRMMTALSIVGIIGAILFSRADSVTSGIIARLILGLGMSCNLMGTLKLMTVWFAPSHFATISGFIFSIGTVGNMAATVPFVALVEWTGWRQAYVAIAALNFLIVIVLFLVVHDKPLYNSTPTLSESLELKLSETLGNLVLLLRKKDYWIISMATLVGYGTFAAFQTLWAGPYLIEVIGLSALQAGNLILLMNLGMIIGSPSWGALSDRVFKTRKWVIFSGTLGTAAVMLILAEKSASPAVITLALLFLCFGTFRSAGLLMYPHIKELVHLNTAGAAMAGVNFFTMVGPAVFLQGLGHLMQALYPEASRGPQAFQAAFYLCAGCLAAISFLYIFTREKKYSAD
ncbi:MAG: MFS transporter [Deltaproteobacteria bacterium]|nr:MAG: MFS transporter [Deltaproteobacteria bacterium]